MTLTLAAVGAVVAAVLELTLWPYLAIGDAHPHLVFVYVVILAVVLGLDAGVTAAFVGGLLLDFLAPRPLGSTAFALLVCAGLAVILARLLVQVRYLAPVIIVFVLSFVYSITAAALYDALGGSAALVDPIRTLLPGVVYDTVIAALVGPLAVALRVAPSRAGQGGLVSLLTPRGAGLRSPCAAVRRLRGRDRHRRHRADGPTGPDAGRPGRGVRHALRSEQPGHPGHPIVTRPDLRPDWRRSSSPTCRASRSRSGQRICRCSTAIPSSARLAALLGKDPADINATIDANAGSRFDLVRVAQDVPETTARTISENHLELPGVEVVVEPRRSYPEGPLVSQLDRLHRTGRRRAARQARDKGYLPDDMIGKAGVEAIYETMLRGTYGEEEVERDARGRKLQVLQTDQAGRAPAPRSS